ncbi:hypothetical protein PG999_005012 [Apiospora kogelbergensis]|uniref:Uncharacterized protein n=1 Tax=Apiospora kogelbergensis TaxID=1337665 RepID=A0AAW0R0W2_9PEZI
MVLKREVTPPPVAPWFPVTAGDGSLAVPVDEDVVVNWPAVLDGTEDDDVLSSCSDLWPLTLGERLPGKSDDEDVVDGAERRGEETWLLGLGIGYC